MKLLVSVIMGALALDGGNDMSAMNGDKWRHAGVMNGADNVEIRGMDFIKHVSAV